jgi:hypothetical protein
MDTLGVSSVGSNESLGFNSFDDNPGSSSIDDRHQTQKTLKRGGLEMIDISSEPKAIPDLILHEFSRISGI